MSTPNLYPSRKTHEGDLEMTDQVTREILLLNSRLRIKNMTANYLKESIAQKELKLKQIAKSILKIERKNYRVST